MQRTFINQDSLKSLNSDELHPQQQSQQSFQSRNRLGGRVTDVQVGGTLNQRIASKPSTSHFYSNQNSKVVQA